MIISSVMISLNHVSDKTSQITKRDYVITNYHTIKIYTGYTEHYEQIAYTRYFHL